jgi:hypothetical protein
MEPSEVVIIVINDSNYNNKSKKKQVVKYSSMIRWMKYGRKANDCTGDLTARSGHVVTTSKGCLKNAQSGTPIGTTSVDVESSDNKRRGGKSSLATSMTAGTCRSDSSSAIVATSKRRHSSSHQYGNTTAAMSSMSKDALTDHLGGVHRRRVSASSAAPSLTLSSYSSSSWKSVSFGTVQIREYSRALSDNPSCTSGPPIG